MNDGRWLSTGQLEIQHRLYSRVDVPSTRLSLSAAILIQLYSRDAVSLLCSRDRSSRVSRSNRNGAQTAEIFGMVCQAHDVTVHVANNGDRQVSDESAKYDDVGSRVEVRARVVQSQDTRISVSELRRYLTEYDYRS